MASEFNGWGSATGEPFKILEIDLIQNILREVNALENSLFPAKQKTLMRQLEWPLGFQEIPNDFNAGQALFLFDTRVSIP